VVPSSRIEGDRLPRHVAIIMDGNGRWAERHGLSHTKGHEAGAKSVRAVIECCREIGIEALTLYAFSTENWQRPKAEVEALFELLSRYVRLELDIMHSKGIRVTVMGRVQGLSERTLDDMTHCMELTKNNKSMIVNVAVNYGARAEIVDATKAIASKAASGDLRIEDIDEECFSRHLYVPTLPELDLLIRTSGEMRVSNFMLWQCSYAEFVPMSVLWPDFRKRHLHQAIGIYQSRQRRFGGRG
jgi:undecaprenyl diphosphate synthase